MCRAVSDLHRPQDESVLTTSSRLANIAVGVIMVLGGISQFFPASLSTIIVGSYVIVFGLSSSPRKSRPLSQLLI